MKKRIGTLKGKPIVEGDSNLVKKTEIDVSTIGNASTDDEYVYFCFPADIFIRADSYKVKISEQTEEKQKILTALIFFIATSKIYTTIRHYYSLEVRYMDFRIIEDDEDTFLFNNNKPLYLKISKILEMRETSGNFDSHVTCMKGDYKKILLVLGNGMYQGNELDPYLISKEEWDKAVEKTYKTYKEITEL